MSEVHENAVRLARARRFSGGPRLGHHRVLGLRSHENDPVLIITAAQVRLRRWRRLPEHAPESLHSGPVDHIRRITVARDALLKQAYGALPIEMSVMSAVRG